MHLHVLILSVSPCQGNVDVPYLMLDPFNVAVFESSQWLIQFQHKLCNYVRS